MIEGGDIDRDGESGDVDGDDDNDDDDDDDDYYYYYYYYRSYIAHNTFGKVSMHFRGKIKTENLNN